MTVFRREVQFTRLVRVTARPAEPGAWDTYQAQCPYRGEVPLEDCVECAHLQSVVWSPDGVNFALRCYMPGNSLIKLRRLA